MDMDVIPDPSPLAHRCELGMCGGHDPVDLVNYISNLRGARMTARYVDMGTEREKWYEKGVRVP